LYSLPQKRKWRPGGQKYMQLGTQNHTKDMVSVHMNSVRDTLAAIRLGKAVQHAISQRSGKQ
jgi:hypothetical protein